ncbi:flagellar motor switch protein FliN/FliY [Kerstersia gyiorum]|uniref:Flagellar motor switch protein FliN n=1 Tax=Kerstersia gyiorum TaxID=206506 RepID=A0A4Q7MMI1_9BURK|nr:flagellar motor switch protein FliN [Kerstersia gyiorum]KAB0544461.1 flagellar motor switch protein FliN [Kerstersia gyiorum]RZS69594.1 flagellar motor switch protein FliN/FliY [Kerstersia gyiorum]
MTTDSSSPNPPPLSADTLAQDLGGTQADGLAQAGENASGMDLWEQALAEQAAATAASAQPAPAQADATSAPASTAATPKRVDFPALSDTAGTSVNDLDIIKDIPVQLTVELGRTRITIKNLLQLGQGSVIELDGLAGEPMDIFVNGFLIAQGEVVVVEDKYGIRLTDIVTPSDRLNRLNKTR